MMRGRQVMAGPGAPAPAVAPQLDRSQAIVFMGGALIVANFITSNPGLLGTVLGPAANLATGRDTLPNLVMQAVGVAALYVVSRISDVAGTAAVLFLAALWLVFIWRHAAGIGQYIGSAGKSAPGGTGSTKG